MRGDLASGGWQRSLKKGKEMSKGRRCRMIDGRGKSKKDLEEREPEGSNVVGTQELLLNRNGGGAAVSGWPGGGPVEGPAGQARWRQK